MQHRPQKEAELLMLDLSKICAMYGQCPLSLDAPITIVSRHNNFLCVDVIRNSRKSATAVGGRWPETDSFQSIYNIFLPHSFWFHLYCLHSHHFYYSLIVYNIFLPHSFWLHLYCLHSHKVECSFFAIHYKVKS